MGVHFKTFNDPCVAKFTLGLRENKEHQQTSKTKDEAHLGLTELRSHFTAFVRKAMFVELKF